MEENKTSVLSNGLIWFGAGVSMSEILTGTYFAPLGMKTGLLAILIGHVIGCILLFLAGYLGAKTNNNAMETVAVSFGRKGNLPFSILNILQLAGWLAILNYDGALAANGIFSAGAGVWCAIIGVLLLVWVLVGLKRLEKINMVAMTALFLMTVALCFVIVTKGNAGAFLNGGSVSGETLSFGAAIELAASMPLSWIPVISDYTSNSTKPVKATTVSTIVYGLVSCWMYIIGMGASIFTGESDIAQIMLRAGLGIPALLILVLSTVTTTFLDAFSAGVSCESLSKKLSGKTVGIIATVIGGDTLPDGRHHELPVPHRQRVRAHDSRAAHDVLYPEKGQLQGCFRLAESHRLAAGLHRLPPADAGGSARRQHPARRGHHDGAVLYRQQARPQQEQSLSERSAKCPR